MRQVYNRQLPYGNGYSKVFHTSNSRGCCFICLVRTRGRDTHERQYQLSKTIPHIRFLRLVGSLAGVEYSVRCLWDLSNVLGRVRNDWRPLEIRRADFCQQRLPRLQRWPISELLCRNISVHSETVLWVLQLSHSDCSHSSLSTTNLGLHWENALPEKVADELTGTVSSKNCVQFFSVHFQNAAQSSFTQELFWNSLPKTPVTRLPW